jgi:NAD(P)-dependent dehydrogenase (short-subunit alcohol dehydrogenase family)
VKRDIAVVIGGTSYIANQVLPELNLRVGKTFFIVRDGSIGSVPNTFSNSEVVLVKRFDSETIESVKQHIALEADTKLLMLNFSGSLGNLFDSDISNVDEFHETFRVNLDPFMQSLKLFSAAGSESLYITFSGAGVGGNSLDDTSLGYLCAKGSIALLVEVLQKRFVSEGKVICSLAPGAFPSRMQQILLDPRLKDHVDKSRVEAAEKLVANGTSADKLILALDFAINNSSKFGGRLISANFDDFQNQIFNDNFGKLRRVHE